MGARTADLPIVLLPFAAIDREETAALINFAFSRYPIMTGDRTSAEDLAFEAGDDAEFLQARRDSELVASAMIRPAHNILEQTDRTPPLTEALYFGLAAVHPREMNAGFGRRLLNDGERIAAERGLKRVVLGTVREFGLVEYYARAGYIVYQQTDYPAGHWGLRTDHRYCEMVREL